MKKEKCTIQRCGKEFELRHISFKQLFCEDHWNDYCDGKSLVCKDGTILNFDNQKSELVKDPPEGCEIQSTLETNGG